MMTSTINIPNKREHDLLTLLETREENYLKACKKYECKIDSGAIVTIRHELKSYKPSIQLCDNDLLALLPVFSDLDHIYELNLSHCNISCNGVYLLCELLRKNKKIELIDLRNNKISDLGAQALSEILQIEATNLKTLILHFNEITECGAFHLAQGLKLNTVLQELDISHNKLGSYGAKIIRAALLERSMHMVNTNNLLMIEHTLMTPQTFNLINDDKNTENNTQSDTELDDDDDEKSCTPVPVPSPQLLRRERSSKMRSPYRPSPQLLQKWMSPQQLQYMQSQLNLFIKFDGNFVKEEIFNSITHALGLLLSIIASIVLMKVSCNNYSLLCQIASGIFCFTLFFMYLSSTLFHSFLRCTCARNVFHVLDFSSIFLLIAGTYTPILLIGFNHSPFHSLILFICIWSMAILGVAYSSYVDPHDSKWKKLTFLYLAMSYSALICAKPFIETFDYMAWVWIAVGGFWYTAGVWFIANDETVPIFHTIWHICVILGSASHFFCILWYIVPMDNVQRPIHQLTLQHILDNIFFALPISKLFSYFDNDMIHEL